MDVLVFVCLLVAVILFALSVPNKPVSKYNLMAAGLAFFALAFLLPAFKAL